MSTEYTRVIPRDFFNEAKLLKCMGLLSLKILDNQTPCEMNIEVIEPTEGEDEGFIIAQTQCGNLTVYNYIFTIKETVVILQSPVNSKENYPMVASYEYCEYTLFNDDGDFTEEFKQFCKTI